MASEFEVVQNRPRRLGEGTIDYERMNREHPTQVKALREAVALGDAVAVADCCRSAVRLWDACGGWPDSWNEWPNALNALLDPKDEVHLSDVAYGLVEIKRRSN